MSEQQTITLSNTLEEIERVQGQLEELAEEVELTPRVLNAILVSVEEVLVNIISYAYPDDGAHAIAVRVSGLGTPVLSIEVEDDGAPFNPLEAPAPATQAPIEQRPVGGLGIHLVKNMMDDVEYRRVGDRNVLVMRKQCVE